MTLIDPSTLGSDQRDTATADRPSKHSRPPSITARILLGGLLVWSLVAMTLRTREVSRRPGSVPLGPALLWRSGTLQVEQWQQFFHAVGGRVPEGAEILIDAPTVDPADEFFLTMWGAYSLPRHTIVRRENLVDPSRLPAYRISTNGELSLMALIGLERNGDFGRVLLEGVGRLTLDASLDEPGR